MILVAGGTGTLGRRVVQLLVGDGEQVRVLTRRRERASALPDGVEVVTGDIRSASDVAAAVRGCDTVVSAVHGFVGAGRPSPELVDRDGNAVLIRAAKDANVARFVLMSVHGARADHPMSLHRAKHAAEEELRRSGVPFTIVRATSFMETWMEVIGAPIAKSGAALVFGAGTNPINFVSVRDVAALVTLSLRERSPKGEVIDIGGPEDIGFVTFAQRLLDSAGKERRIKHIPLLALRLLSVLARPFWPVFARQAHAAVVMNTTAMTCGAPVRERFPALPTTTLGELLA
jgi:uncharacterized protein YbjT (DUF2867 family)